MWNVRQDTGRSPREIVCREKKITFLYVLSLLFQCNMLFQATTMLQIYGLISCKFRVDMQLNSSPIINVHKNTKSCFPCQAYFLKRALHCYQFQIIIVIVILLLRSKYCSLLDIIFTTSHNYNCSVKLSPLDYFQFVLCPFCTIVIRYPCMARNQKLVEIHNPSTKLLK